MQTLSESIKNWGLNLGFQQVGITDIALEAYKQKLEIWLARGWHGSMSYMAKHGDKRSQPDKLIPGTLRVISVRLDYLEANTQMVRVLRDKQLGYISRYALGRDYHRLMRKRLQSLAEKIHAEVSSCGYRVFCDSAPVLEKPLAEKAGLGWIGKHTNLINPKGGSWFFLGEIYTDMPLPIDVPMTKSHCGTCHACIDVCPTQAIVAPYQLDARRCISYLTIESKAAIPLTLRPLLGNRIYGCDDCQMVCPWNKFAKYTQEKDFVARHQLNASTLLSLFAWDEKTFLAKTEGSAIRRIGYEMWMRNIAVALGNANFSEEIMIALRARLGRISALVDEHIEWALMRHHHAQRAQVNVRDNSVTLQSNRECQQGQDA